MPDLEEAREQAFQLVAREYVADKSFFNEGWIARGQYDEQRIAALVAALEEVRDQLWRYLGGRSARARAINGAFDTTFNALRALAGQTENAE